MTVKASTVLVVVVRVKVNMVTVSRISVTVPGSAVTVVVFVTFPNTTVTVADARINEGSQTVLVHVYGISAVVVATPAVSRGHPHMGSTTCTAVHPPQSMLLNCVRDKVWTVKVLSVRQGLERAPIMVVVHLGPGGAGEAVTIEDEAGEVSTGEVVDVGPARLMVDVCSGPPTSCVVPPSTLGP